MAVDENPVDRALAWARDREARDQERLAEAEKDLAGMQLLRNDALDDLRASSRVVASLLLAVQNLIKRDLNVGD